MPSRLSKILSRSSKEKEAEAEAERNNSNGSSSSPPPEYTQQPPQYDEEDVLDPPDITAGFNNLSLNRSGEDIPQVDQCTAHLKVLECFYRLRQKIGASDGLFGIDNSSVVDQGLQTDDKTPELLAKLAEKRWAIYVTRAAERFETWSAAITPAAQMINRTDLEKVGKEGRICEPDMSAPQIKFDKNNIPPADVLMVWHAYMLNPRAYLEDCLRLGRMQLWHSGMPWQGAVDSINSETFAYEAGQEAAKVFTSITALPWNELDDLSPKSLECTECKMRVKVAWTTCPDFAPNGKYNSWKSLERDIDHMLSSGEGYCDKDFRTICTACGMDISHERLKAKKFCDDTQRLLDSNIPMGGTVLGDLGLPWKFLATTTDISCNTCCFVPNNLLQAGLGRKIIDEAPLKGRGLNQSMEGIREVLEEGMSSRSYMRHVRNSGSGRMLRGERIGIRRMMSRYWENSSPFALDLVGAVIRQGSFIEKMHNIDWLHSPALPGTMKRLLVKYARFVSIMSDKRNMAVPTLDVDLAWHTHQLSPYSYMTYTVKTTKQFIDHDDKVAETKLNDAFAWTSKTYQKLYAEPYSECTCWYCEAVRESHTSAASRMFKTTNRQANDKLHDVEQDPRKSVHISTHNAVRPTGDSTYDASSKMKADQLERQYQKACERARKKGRKEPKRDDYYYSDAWGYPVFIPAYSPYIGFYPYMPMYYPMTPGCMALGAGAAGNCCQGTCGGGVAAGGCGGAGGAGGCAGGAGMYTKRYTWSLASLLD